MSAHADPVFEAKYGFCPIPCEECARLDEEELVTGVTSQEIVEQAWTMAARAVAAEVVTALPAKVFTNEPELAPEADDE